MTATAPLMCLCLYTLRRLLRDEEDDDDDDDSAND